MSRNKGSYNVALQHKDAHTSFVIPSISSHIIEDNSIPHSSNIMLAKTNKTTIINTNTTATTTISNITKPNHILNSNTSNSGSIDINNVDDARVGVFVVNNGTENYNMEKNRRQCLDIQFNDTKKSGIILHIPTKSNNNAKRRTSYTTSMSCDMNHEKFTPCITSCRNSCSTISNTLMKQHEKSISVHSASTITDDINANQLLLHQKNVKQNSSIIIRNNYHQQYNDENVGMSMCLNDNNDNNVNAIVKIQPPPRHKRKNKVVISCSSSSSSNKNNDDHNKLPQQYGNKNANTNKSFLATQLEEMATKNIITKTETLAPIIVPSVENEQIYISLDKSLAIATTCQPTDVHSTSRKILSNKLDPWTVKLTDDDTLTKTCTVNENKIESALNEYVTQSFEDHFVAGDQCSNRNESNQVIVSENDGKNLQQNMKMLQKGNSIDIFKNFDTIQLCEKIPQQQCIQNLNSNINVVDENLPSSSSIQSYRHHLKTATAYSLNSKKTNSISFSNHMHNNTVECKCCSKFHSTDDSMNFVLPKINENFQKYIDNDNIQSEEWQKQNQHSFRNNFIISKKCKKYNNDECGGWKNKISNSINVEIPSPSASPDIPLNYNELVFMDDRKNSFDEDSLTKSKVNNDDNFVAKHAMDSFSANKFAFHNDDGNVNGQKNVYAKCRNSGFFDNANSGSSSSGTSNTIANGTAKSLFENGKIVSENEHLNGKLSTYNILYYCFFYRMYVDIKW